MTSLLDRGEVRERFLRDGYVAVEGALQPDFCEEVVASAFARMGVDEGDPASWPRGRTNLAVEHNWSLADVAPAAGAVVEHLVGGRSRLTFSGVQDNLIVNLPDPEVRWWGPDEASDHLDGWHKDGDWFRHFLDSPEQALLVIVFWRDVAAAQGATYVAVDSIAPVARLLAEHPEGLDPSELRDPVRRIVVSCRDIRAMTGAQGTVVFAHPFMVHSATVNGTNLPRVISNSSVMLTEPMRFDRPHAELSVVEESVLAALDVDTLAFTPTGSRRRVESERSRRWAVERQSRPET